mmetsp:Transcript_16675/g.45263  ORF Transcript_16675/g.45263 Transcript_16675/m.45263 type:complete len:215 (-) Transcript_16675:862-1506(-)
MSPYLIFQNFTEASLCFFLSSAGSPDSKEQGPAETPGSAILSFRWSFSPSSHSILPRVSCQMDMLKTMPRSSASPTDLSPPYLPKTPLPAPPEASKASSWALHSESVRDLPASSSPRAVALEFLMILPSCSQILRISERSPVSVPSFVMNCVTTVIGLLVSTLKSAPFPKNFWSPMRHELKPQPSLSHRPGSSLLPLSPHSSVPLQRYRPCTFA